MSRLNAKLDILSELLTVLEEDDETSEMEKICDEMAEKVRRMQERHTELVEEMTDEVKAEAEKTGDFGLVNLLKATSFWAKSFEGTYKESKAVLSEGAQAYEAQAQALANSSGSEDVLIKMPAYNIEECLLQTESDSKKMSQEIEEIKESNKTDLEALDNRAKELQSQVKIIGELLEETMLEKEQFELEVFKWSNRAHSAKNRFPPFNPK